MNDEDMLAAMRNSLSGSLAGVHMTQPAVSGRISQIEDPSGVVRPHIRGSAIGTYSELLAWARSGPAIAGFPRWLRFMSVCDPFTYAVHAFRSLLLKDVGIAAITTDIVSLTVTSIVVLAGATLRFRRTL